MGAQEYTALQLMQVVGDNKVRIIPDIAVGGDATGNGLIEALLGVMLQSQLSVVRPNPVDNGSSKTS
jgi:hypothetical protein